MQDKDTGNQEPSAGNGSGGKRKLTVLLETYGCQMNEYDSELVRSILKKENYEFVADESGADIVMLNTCAIREHAHRKVYGRVHSIRHARGKENPVMIGILGCMATNLRRDLLEDRSLKIDFIAGPDSYKRLGQLIREACDEGQKSYDVTLSEFETYADVYPSRKEGINAWIAVMRGCNNFCTFCVVPYTRGRERSRSPENITEEVRRLVAEGFKQVTLLGQNVNSYRHETHDFAYLMDQVSRVPGIERVRFTSPHPKDFPDRFLDLMAVNPKICKHIHLPLQAGNNRILDMMNRTYTHEEFMDLVAKIRRKIPEITLTTDIIVGFPTETDNEFEDTLHIVAAAGFDSAFTFKYSERQGTMACRKYPDDVPEAAKTERIMRLNELQKEITFKKNLAHIGQVHDILIEPSCQDKPVTHTVGRTDGNKLVILSRNGYQTGEMVKVKITDATPHALKACP
ncbi:MAG: tRNA (N6-isopentenyl adenosine(37)-C2)-methylthiotransferase MiaB [Candidatus Omnitrophica bacterium]|nr:tRNA (N6-isopentenyl adenosine(37)-C2)-methylthiotransferase MiaB [Candidatus Omnitrophota bacterium]